MVPTNSAGQYYNDLAPRYDVLTANGAWTPNRLLREALELIACDKPSLLDLGTGTGQSLEALPPSLSPHRTVAVDMSSSMCAIVRRKFPDATVVSEDLEAFLAHNTERFDIITAIGVFEFVPSLPLLLADITRHLRPRGRLLFTYEPIIDGLGVQSERGSETKSSGPSQAILKTYRWRQQEVESVVAASLRTEARTLSVAYRRGGEPVIYELIQAIK